MSSATGSNGLGLLQPSCRAGVHIDSPLDGADCMLKPFSTELGDTRNARSRALILKAWHR
jgi:hypothetical protein